MLPGLQYLLTATWDGARQRGLPLERVSHLLSGAPAALAGLSACKGALVAGLDADIVVRARGTWACVDSLMLDLMCSLVCLVARHHSNTLAPGCT